jgi:hypothetical protein
MFEFLKERQDAYNQIRQNRLLVSNSSVEIVEIF